MGLVAVAMPPINAISMTAVDGGIGPSSMVGTQLTLKNLYIRYSFQCGYDTGLTVPVTNIARCLVVWHKQWNQQATAPTLTTYLPVGTLISTGVDMLVSKRWSNRKQFTILHDKIYYMVDADATSTHQGGSFKIPLKNRKVVLAANAVGANTNVETGAIWVYLFTNNPGTNSPMYYAFAARLTYTDA